MMRAVALLLLLAAVLGWAGLVTPAQRERDRARAEFASARKERERLRAEVAALERRSGGARTPTDAAEASRALRRSFLRATEGLAVAAVQISVSGSERAGARGSLIAEGRLADLLRVTDRLADPDLAIRIERVSLSEVRGRTGQPLRIEIQGAGARAGS